MARFYFRVEDTFFYLDSTTDVKTVYPADISSSPMQAGEDQSDNYIIKQPICSMSGRITDIKTANSADTRPTGQWIDDFLSRVRDNGSSVILKNRVDAEETQNWFVTNFTVSQDNKTYCVGYQDSQGGVTQSFRVQIQFKQTLLARGITSTVQPSQAYIDPLQSKGKKNAATQQFDETTKGQESYQKSFAKAKESSEAIFAPLPTFQEG